ncbi:hypothetical protein C1H76_1119 [Elsinoe australis]|uniref:RNA polymerase II subunit B1 CTD phosphatase RPAP2 homolog n=1 Tax=Elsinoe australis TaxID=40998 RepID=A0A4U7BEV0_9PEZI|nr:hypothetical protein C1H76_1119 [Elsinoe australis]
MATTLPKSILKKTAAQSHVEVPPNVNIPAPKSDAEARNLRTALLHAEQIKAQKETQLQILESIEALSLLPSTNPAPVEEVAQFRNEVALFQPSDYMALLEERNVNGFCGYTLCDRPPPKQVTKKLDWLRTEGEKRFCGKECARKALYVRAQLDETPAWERRAGLEAEIKLKDDDTEMSLPTRVKQENAQVSETTALANDRSEKAGSKKVTLVTDDIVEKQPTRSASGGFVKFEFDDMVHDSIEGYRISSKKLGKEKIKPDDG